MPGIRPLPAVAASGGGGPLGRHGETAADALLKAAIWRALQEVKDAQFYTLDANVVDLRYVYDVRVRAATVSVVFTMPRRGRPVYTPIGDPIRERLLSLDGVREVIIEFTWEPPWTAARMTAAGCRTMGGAGTPPEDQGRRVPPPSSTFAVG